MIDAAMRTDEEEIRGLAEAYAVAMDEVDLEAFPRLFVPDGGMAVYGLGDEAPMGTFEGPGPDGVGLIATLMDELYAATLHNVTTQLVRPDGDRATATTYCIAYHVTGTDGILETLGVRYVDDLERTPEGWRFRMRHATRLWSQRTSLDGEPLLIDRAAARR